VLGPGAVVTVAARSLLVLTRARDDDPPVRLVLAADSGADTPGGAPARAGATETGTRPVPRISSVPPPTPARRPAR
ncbi:MAG: hypothetical protein P8Z68_03255, partial [Kineosporiaceae bacterium]